ncbi:MAG: hypothetical protein GX895_00120 [Clostridiales bacterium]|uniref:phage holin, LLH family n=1 Tax=Clostridium sp. N3C TaxID=1776758 RepID=UPI00092DF03C|nr:phage holin, LLH family [Clostridium sp. N3C]NLZ47192.1 hypothetical protein [Clostridiales bacterium]SCN25811.1 hypothetical protein N3C_2532 [Clostridium sp. N3C]
MTSQLLTYIIVFAVALAVIAIVVGLVPFLRKKGVNLNSYFATANNVVTKANYTIDFLNEVMPDNKVVDILEIIAKWAKIAVGNAEQLYHTGEIKKDERAEVANKVVINVLEMLNIEVTDNLKTLINAAIEDAVNTLGHEITAAK